MGERECGAGGRALGGRENPIPLLWTPGCFHWPFPGPLEILQTSLLKKSLVSGLLKASPGSLGVVLMMPRSGPMMPRVTTVK